jgi:hypothetical protein
MTYNDKNFPKSFKSQKRIDEILAGDWKSLFFQMLEQEITKTLTKLHEYQELNPKCVHSIVRVGVDVLQEQL